MSPIVGSPRSLTRWRIASDHDCSQSESVELVERRSTSKGTRRSIDRDSQSVGTFASFLSISMERFEALSKRSSIIGRR